MTGHVAPLALTAGEPAGIGPDLCVRLAQDPPDFPLVILANRRLLEERAAQLGLPCHIPDHMAGTDQTLSLISLPLPQVAAPGRLDPANADYVLACLDRAVDGCRSGAFSGMVTGPVHKGVINDAGHPFTGHTEYLADRTGTDQVVMMLTGGGMRVALATTHLPLRKVADAITRAGLSRTLQILDASLRRDFALERPRILVAGLNPHAGEGGHLGQEEIQVIQPVLAQLRDQGMDLIGPLPADTLFQKHHLEACDAVLAMYHDQGLPVLKHASFGAGINVTLGLPIIRTSVDHGTALDLAGTGRVHDGSLRAALDLAWEMACNRGRDGHA